MAINAISSGTSVAHQVQKPAQQQQAQQAQQAQQVQQVNQAQHGQGASIGSNVNVKV